MFRGILLLGSLNCTGLFAFDGDTIAVTCFHRERINVRICGIDAPEKNQPFGRESTENMRRLIARRRITLFPIAHDKYGRLVARVVSDQIDTAEDQARRGFAWPQNYGRPCPNDPQIQRAFTFAQQNQIGIHATPTTPPWQFRQQQESKP